MKNDYQYKIKFFGLSWVKEINIPPKINKALNSASTPLEI